MSDSKFKVGDRVKYCGSLTEFQDATGTVVEVVKYAIDVKWDDMAECHCHAPNALALMPHSTCTPYQPVTPPKAPAPQKEKGYVPDTINPALKHKRIQDW